MLKGAEAPALPDVPEAPDVASLERLLILASVFCFFISVRSAAVVFPVALSDMVVADVFEPEVGAFIIAPLLVVPVVDAPVAPDVAPIVDVSFVADCANAAEVTRTRLASRDVRLSVFIVIPQ